MWVPRWTASPGLLSSAAGSAQKVPCRKYTSCTGTCSSCCWWFLLVMLLLLARARVCWPNAKLQACVLFGLQEIVVEAGERQVILPLLQSLPMRTHHSHIMALLGQGHKNSSARARTWDQEGENPASQAAGLGTCKCHGKAGCTPATGSSWQHVG